ncbi:RNA polymerase III RPC4-domain-containing protein [Chiua virens]|nr:RNA polymerase III RPC4-domain-containing protein [Chiua virens]
MSDNPEQSTGPKAIASLAKKQSDVTRQGTQRLKFTPTLSARRKKEEVKQEPAQASAPPSDKGDGRGRGRGRGRGAVLSQWVPALAGTSARRGASRTNFTPVVPQGSAKSSALAANLSNSAAPTLKKEKQRESLLAGTTQTPKVESDEEVYSEPDEGVEIIDMVNVRQMDWMAPETLQKNQRDRRKGVIREIEEAPLSPTSSQQGNTSPFSTPHKINPSVGPSAKSVDPSNALDLDQSEEEEDLEDLIEDFASQITTAEVFTRTFSNLRIHLDANFRIHQETMDVDALDPGPSKRKVSFAADVKSPDPSGSGSTIPRTQAGAEVPKQLPEVDGVIGHMEVYRSGIVRMRLGNGIVLNVSEATQASFLQQAVHLDMENKNLHVLGEISKRFVVSPDLDALLASMELADVADKSTTLFDDADLNLIKMDTNT